MGLFSDACPECGHSDTKSFELDRIEQLEGQLAVERKANDELRAFLRKEDISEPGSVLTSAEVAAVAIGAIETMSDVCKANEELRAALAEQQRRATHTDRKGNVFCRMRYGDRGWHAPGAHPRDTDVASCQWCEDYVRIGAALVTPMKAPGDTDPCDDDSQ